MDDYLQDFIRESEENITELNNALLDLERDPEDEAAMDSIFRTAHTLKGNFAAMGFAGPSKLAHAIEDLLEEIRQDRMSVTGDAMDVVFDGVDEIDLALDQIEADGQASVEPDATIERIRAVVEDGPADAGDSRAVDAAASSDGDERDERDDAGATAEDPAARTVEAALDALDAPEELAGRDVVYAFVELRTTGMKGVDAMFVLSDITDSFDVLGANPDVDAIQDGEYEEGFGVFLASESDAAVEAAVSDIGKVDGVTVVDVTDALPEPDDGAPADAAEAADASRTEPSTEPGSPDAADAAADGDDPRSVEEIKSIRVDVEQLDDLHGLVEQLVTSRIKLRRSLEGDERKSASDNLDELDKITASLQDTVMDMRLVPMKKVVDKFPRLVRDIARSQDKEIEFVMEGEDIELDRTILNEISDPLLHLLRNAADHGVEAPAEREASGKPRTGTIRLRGERERDRVTITVEDDGRGLDADALRSTAVEKGIVSRERAAELEESEAYELIFHPGFSTSDEVTDISGRGVGMDVVNNTIKRLDGSIGVDSELGEGTTISLSLPVTVAIVKVLFVESGDEEYGIPIKNVDEISRMSGVKTVEGREVITHDDEVYPLVRLGDALSVPGAKTNGDGMLVRVKKSERRIAIHCDRVTRQEEVVVKPFEGILSGIPGLSGAAVLGEGDVVTILDVEGL